jgi:hypothetical protein
VALDEAGMTRPPTRKVGRTLLACLCDGTVAVDTIPAGIEKSKDFLCKRKEEKQKTNMLFNRRGHINTNKQNIEQHITILIYSTH